MRSSSSSRLILIRMCRCLSFGFGSDITLVVGDKVAFDLGGGIERLFLDERLLPRSPHSCLFLPYSFLGSVPFWRRAFVPNQLLQLFLCFIMACCICVGGWAAKHGPRCLLAASIAGACQIRRWRRLVSVTGHYCNQNVVKTS